MKITSIIINYKKHMGDDVHTPIKKFIEYNGDDKSWRSDAQLWPRDIKLITILLEYMKEFD